MKNQILKTIVTISFVFLFAVISANAQSMQLRAHIPFDFYINNQKCTAGDYVISKISDSNQQILLIRQKDGKAQAIAQTIEMKLTDKQRTGDAVLVFNRYGEDYFLSEIRNPWNAFGGQLPQAKTERNLARKISHSNEETVSLKSAKN